jgi:hypothetical protein
VRDAPKGQRQDGRPVHLAGQDIGGIGTPRLAAGHPTLARSFDAIET